MRNGGLLNWDQKKSLILFRPCCCSCSGEEELQMIKPNIGHSGAFLYNYQPIYKYKVLSHKVHVEQLTFNYGLVRKMK